MSDHREAIAEVLAAHRLTSAGGCGCGWTVTRHTSYEEVEAHLADALLGSDVLAQIRAEARAEALREAADVLSYQSWVDGRPEYRAGPENCANWLRDRAEGSA